ncbi:hypothetical protein N8502_05135 [Gammaproteobacteria bacterium]|nr:hypothetical protein [Gammaproteobacteria bacterium]
MSIVLSSGLTFATGDAENTSPDHTGSSGHGQSATDYNQSGAGAIVTNRLNSQTLPLGSGSADGSAALELDVYNDGAGYADARASISAGIDANAMCSPCGASINLYETKYSDSDASSRITYLADTHSFTGDVSTGVLSVTNGDVGFSDVAGAIETNLQASATNTTGIASNKTNIATNTTGIASNKTNIATNTTGIATNVTNISANTSLISANTATLQSLISVNVTGIQSLSSSFTSFQEDTNRNFIALSGNMYEGLAEVTAISNVAYASSGWRASVGYGDYKSKSATAVGISYAGEKYKFKFSKGGDATGFGISYDF